MITIKTIQHARQKYETIGNWWFEKKNLQIRISKMNNWKYECLVGIHELVEALLCFNKKIDEKKVSQFDIKFEKERKKGLHSKWSEPGNDFKAPYFWQHQIAGIVERFVAVCLKVSWREYTETIINL